MTFDEWIGEYFPELVGAVHFLPEVVEKDLHQSEFTAPPWHYIEKLATDARIARGQELCTELYPNLRKITAQYHVKPALLIAIWGVETNFGENLGDYPVGSAIASLAFAGRVRRRPYFTTQLGYFRTHIFPQQDILGKISGSWAGASGHMQFMPETYAKFADPYGSVGSTDIWGSILDSLNSAANYLHTYGAKNTGTLIKYANLETDIGYHYDGIGHACDADGWAERGLHIDDASEGEKYFCVSPAGRHGPRVLLGEHGAAIYQYNHSIHYVLAVAKIASAIEDSPIDWSWDKTKTPLSSSEIAELQMILNHLGYDAGAADGITGPDTACAVMRLQTDLGKIADGYPDAELLAAIRGKRP